MKIAVTIDEEDVKRMVLERLQRELPHAEIEMKHVKLEVKSKNNYRPQEWEEGRLQVRVET